MTARSGPTGYSGLSILVHWLTAILVIALFVTHEGDRGSAAQAFHVGGGAIAGLFLLWRVWHRARHGLPEPGGQAAIFNVASRIVFIGFLAAIVAVVVTGYLLPRSLGRPLDIYGLVAIPSPLPRMPWLHTLSEDVHDIAGHLFIPLLGLHLLGAAKHAFVDRDGIAMRIFRPVRGGR